MNHFFFLNDSYNIRNYYLMMKLFQNRRRQIHRREEDINWKHPSHRGNHQVGLHDALYSDPSTGISSTVTFYFLPSVSFTRCTSRVFLWFYSLTTTFVSLRRCRSLFFTDYLYELFYPGGETIFSLALSIRNKKKKTFKRISWRKRIANCDNFW